MPKDTTKKNSKGANTKATKTTKAVTSKKANTKKAPVKKVETKKVPAKKVEAKVTKKEIEVKEIVKEKKGKKVSIFKRAKIAISKIISKVMENTPLVIALCVIIVLIAALILTLCLKRIPKISDGKEIFATMTGKTITADDLYEELKEEDGYNALINIIDSYIADKEVEITEENEKYVQEVVDYYKEYAEYYGTDLTTFLSSYAGISGITTEEEFYNYVLEDYKKTLVVTNYLADQATEEELKEYYKENYSDKLTVKHILIEVDAEAEDAEKADKEAYNKAKDLIKKIKKIDSKKLDKEFKKLAEDNSDDTATYSNGGLIEDFSKKDVVEEFWEASEKLKDGEFTTEPVKTTYGYHIILKVGSTPVEKYKEIKNDVKTKYAESLLSEDSTLMVKTWDEIRKQYKLSIKDDFMKKTYKQTIKDATTEKEAEDSKETETEE